MKSDTKVVLGIIIVSLGLATAFAWMAWIGYLEWLRIWGNTPRLYLPTRANLDAILLSDRYALVAVTLGIFGPFSALIYWVINDE